MEWGVLQKKRVFVFLFFLPFLAVFGRGLVFFMFFGVFFFMVVSGTNASCGTKEPLFFEYFWHFLFLRRLLAESFFVFFPSCMTYQVVLQSGTHMCNYACKSMMKWQIEVQWGPHIYRRCGIWDVTSICHGMYTCNRRSHSR